MSYERKYRGKTQNLYLIEIGDHDMNTYSKSYIIMGSTGNIYTVTIKDIPSCTCPDYISRGCRCKHIYFVLKRIIGVNEDELTYSTEDLQQMFDKSLIITPNVEA